MAQYDGMVLTNDGINLLAKCQLGQKIEFTKVLIGDGRVPEGKTFQEMTALVNTKLALGIQNVDFVEDGRVDVTAIIDNSGLEVGFFVREIGLFAKQVGGADVLYAYTNAGDLADYLPNAKVNEVTDQIVVQSIITNKENVVINLNDNFVIATKADLKKHDESVNVHVNLMDAHNADTSAHEPAFNAHNADTSAHSNVFAKYLPLAGGTMTGAIITSNIVLGRKTDNTGEIGLLAGADVEHGAAFVGYGANYSNAEIAGMFRVRATDGSYIKDLCGKPDGELSWNGKNIVRSINGVNADINGNVDLIPAGTMQMFAGNTIPAGWLLCDGSAVSRTDYAKLFSAIGTTWGAGDGSTTFNLPNSIGRFAEGAATSGSYKSAGLPNITGSISAFNNYWFATANRKDGAIVTNNPNYSNSLYANATSTVQDTSSRGASMVSFNAQNSNAIYGNSTTVQPASYTVRKIIKY